ncbi:hypothetical protein HanRHA438_Chr15g0711171 [Helianthus annuus]|nr:hypothetical protein HanRHA438_Chr15g0711171 [Helianthus annuus]
MLPYTSQIVVMAMVALAIGAADSIITKQRREGILESLLSLPGKITDFFRAVTCYVWNYATAFEGALNQVKEVALMHTEGMHAGEMKHLPIVVIASYS